MIDYDFVSLDFSLHGQSVRLILRFVIMIFVVMLMFFKEANVQSKVLLCLAIDYVEYVRLPQTIRFIWKEHFNDLQTFLVKLKHFQAIYKLCKISV